MIKEPLGVDFYVDPKPLTTQDQKMITDFIKAEKAKSNSGKNAVKSGYAKQSRVKRGSDLQK